MAEKGVRFFTIDVNHHGQRLDNYLLRVLSGVPKTRIYNLIRRDEIRVNKKRVKASSRLQEGDILRVAPIRMSEAVKQEHSQKLNIRQYVLQDVLHFMVIDKPAGLAVHGGSGISLGLIEQLRLQFHNNYLQLAHRLDRETSGLVLVAKTRKGLLELQRLIVERKLHKQYYALVHGEWKDSKKCERAKLRKFILPNKQRIVRVAEDGQEAYTRFHKLRSNGTYSLLSIQLHTGRTHQIRVHCQYNNCAVVGDSKYSVTEEKHERMYLHAATLAFKSKLLGEQRFESTLPKSFEDLIA